MDSPSAQLLAEQAEYEQNSSSQEGSDRALLHHLNCDSSWLLQIPLWRRKSHDGAGGEELDPSRRSRRYFNILIDPWLDGSQTDVGDWLSKQWFPVESRYSNIKSVEALLAKTETPESSVEDRDSRDERLCELSLIDAVAICHEFTDHCHHDTLVQLPPSVPVFATPTPAKLVRSWGHFENVYDLQPFGADKQRHDGEDDHIPRHRQPPPGFGISYVSSGYKGNIGTKRIIDFHVCLVFSFPASNVTAPPSSQAPQAQQVIIYTPHGIPASALSPITSLQPAPEVLCLIHGRHEFRLLGGWLNLGAKNALGIIESLKVRNWVGTHDIIKPGAGIVKTYLRRVDVDVESAIRERSRQLQAEERTDGERSQSDQESYYTRHHVPAFHEPRNGETIVLA